mmetsp:Transcript_62368/g.203473  ORF Transcript_62368/g.203473 Transcript_62368/m.203473 type:complete len:502 (-) Transcript_62368:1126-2631(-)
MASAQERNCPAARRRSRRRQTCRRPCHPPSPARRRLRGRAAPRQRPPCRPGLSFVCPCRRPSPRRRRNRLRLRRACRRSPGGNRPSSRRCRRERRPWGRRLGRAGPQSSAAEARRTLFLERHHRRRGLSLAGPCRHRRRRCRRRSRSRPRPLGAAAASDCRQRRPKPAVASPWEAHSASTAAKQPPEKPRRRAGRHAGPSDLLAGACCRGRLPTRPRSAAGLPSRLCRRRRHAWAAVATRRSPPKRRIWEAAPEPGRPRPSLPPPSRRPAAGRRGTSADPSRRLRSRQARRRRGRLRKGHLRGPEGPCRSGRHSSASAGGLPGSHRFRAAPLRRHPPSTTAAGSLLGRHRGGSCAGPCRSEILRSRHATPRGRHHRHGQLRTSHPEGRHRRHHRRLCLFHWRQFRRCWGARAPSLATVLAEGSAGRSMVAASMPMPRSMGPWSIGCSHALASMSLAGCCDRRPGSPKPLARRPCGRCQYSGWPRRPSGQCRSGGWASSGML